jgi:pimeloyl-ACP methyl ester carboxylesterase
VFDTYDYLGGGGSGASRGRQADEDYSDSEGMNYSVECNEEYVFSDYDTAYNLAASQVPDPFLPALFSGPSDYFAVCDIWGAGTAGPIEDQAVVSDIPTLVMAGEYDPITPVRWAELAASTLSNSTLVVIPASGHGVTGSDACANEIADQFVADPSISPDTSCVDPSIVPYWVLPGDPLD